MHQDEVGAVCVVAVIAIFGGLSPGRSKTVERKRQKAGIDAFGFIATCNRRPSSRVSGPEDTKSRCLIRRFASDLIVSMLLAFCEAGKLPNSLTSLSSSSKKSK